MNAKEILELRQSRSLREVVPYKETHEERLKALSKTLGSIVMDSILITRSLKTEIITITTQPRLIISPPHVSPYIISNPNQLLDLTQSAVLFNGTQVTSGNTEATPLNVANFLNIHLHLNVSSVIGQWDFFARTKDPFSGNWADSQLVFTGINSVGTSYASIGTIGVVSQFAIRWVPVIGGSITFSITATVKDSVAGSPTGLSRTIFIGGRNVNQDNGYPILEGGREIVKLGEEVELWAVALTSTTIKVFTL